MASGRGFERGIGLGLQAAKQYSDIEEAEKDRALRKEMQGSELASRKADREDKQKDRDSAMAQLQARLAAGADSDDKQIGAALDRLNITIGSQEDIAQMKDLLSRDTLDEQGRRFLTEIGMRESQFKQLHALNQEKHAEDKRRNLEMEQLGRNKQADTSAYQGDMVRQGDERLRQQAARDKSDQDLNKTRGDAMKKSMYGDAYQNWEGLNEMESGMSQQEQDVRDTMKRHLDTYDGLINTSDTWQRAMDLALEQEKGQRSMQENLAKLQRENAYMLGEAKKQFLNRQTKITNTPTKYKLSQDFYNDPDTGERVTGDTYITGEGNNLEDILDLQKRGRGGGGTDNRYRNIKGGFFGGRTHISPGGLRHGDVPQTPEQSRGFDNAPSLDAFQEWQRQKREGK